jgi:hypothetical protein
MSSNKSSAVLISSPDNDRGNRRAAVPGACLFGILFRARELPETKVL